MPRYSFENQKNHKTIQIDMPFQELEQFLIENPELKQVFNINYAYRIGSISKHLPSDYKHRLKTLKNFYDKPYQRSSINDNF